MKILLRNIFLYLIINFSLVFGLVFICKILYTADPLEPVGNILVLFLPIVIYVFVVLTKGIVEDIIEFVEKKLNKKKH